MCIPCSCQRTLVIYILLNKKRRTHLALRLPEIVAIITKYVYFSYGNTNSSSNSSSGSNKNINNVSRKALNQLYQCLFVNRLWQDSAARIMYRDLYFNEHKADHDTFIKFSSAFIDAPELQQNQSSTLSLCRQCKLYIRHCTCTPASLAVANPLDNNNDGQQQQYQQHKRKSLSPSGIRSSPSNYISSQNNENEKLDYLSISSLHTNNNSNLVPLDDERLQRLNLYRRTLRTLTLRKMKEDTLPNVFQSLQQVGKHASRLERLELYICDSITDTCVYPFLTHGTLTHLTLAGCYNISDALIHQVARSCPNLILLDVRACGNVSDSSIIQIALNCPKLRHLNVGRVREQERISTASISLIAQRTDIAVLGLAGCDITDECMLLLAHHRNKSLERISVNNCRRLTNKSLHAFVEKCLNLAVFEMKECHLVNDWASVAEMVKRKVLLTLCEQQNRDCVVWAKKHGRTLDVRAPLK
ncbi:hypothetical protein BDC45DRAFT_551323 [Circinella umbellata]|nr:hypothetical protein BDC45DRAFT_551323 [Circinella umbellata]